MKHLTFMCFLLCLFACSSEDIVSTVEESAKPANELTAQTVNLLDSLEIMEYIDSIISSFPKTRDHVTGYLLKDGWDYQLTEEQIELIRNSLPRPLFTQESYKKHLLVLIILIRLFGTTGLDCTIVMHIRWGFIRG